MPEWLWLWLCLSSSLQRRREQQEAIAARAAAEQEATARTAAAAAAAEREAMMQAQAEAGQGAHTGGSLDTLRGLVGTVSDGAVSPSHTRPRFGACAPRSPTSPDIHGSRLRAGGH
jgi:hypothetical protein